jgi:hypothetical protein
MSKRPRSEEQPTNYDELSREKLVAIVRKIKEGKELSRTRNLEAFASISRSFPAENSDQQPPAAKRRKTEVSWAWDFENQFARLFLQASAAALSPSKALPASPVKAKTAAVVPVEAKSPAKPKAKTSGSAASSAHAAAGAGSPERKRELPAVDGDGDTSNDKAYSSLAELKDSNPELYKVRSRSKNRIINKVKESMLKQFLPPTSGRSKSKRGRSAGSTHRRASLCSSNVVFSEAEAKARAELLDGLRAFNLDRSYTDLPADVQELAEAKVAKDLQIYSERLSLLVVVAELARCCQRAPRASFCASLTRRRSSTAGARWRASTRLRS